MGTTLVKYAAELPPLCVDDDYREQIIGHETIPGGHKTYPPTRTTSRPYAETNQRKPYLPVEDISTPGLDEGVSYRQKL